MTREAAQRAATLRERITHHDHRYYTLDAPEITDAEYDALMMELRTLERRHPELGDEASPTRRVGGALASHLPTVLHPEPMLSLGNCFTTREIAEWHDRTVRRLGMAEFPMVAEPKIDGMAIRITYRNGRFVQAVTRGNGAEGEDVTNNVRTVRNIPLHLEVLPGEGPPETLEVRGEIYMPRSAFLEASQEREQQGETAFSNPRNAAAGTVRQLDPELASRRNLRAWVYDARGLGNNSHRLTLTDLEDMRLPVNPLNRLCWNVEEIERYHRTIMELRDELDYEIDGIVIKVDHLSLRERLGATNREPRWAIALKFPSGSAETLLREIRISHGRFGRLTPVAVLDPVELGGVVIQSATLHNLEDMERKDIRPGVRVIVERAGDVIPQVTGPVDRRENNLAERFRMPSECPACGTTVETQGSDAGHWCPNQDCPALLPEQLKSFVGKRAMEIDGLGEHFCQQLVERGLVRNTADIYFISRDDWLKLDRMGGRLADRILRNIEGSRQQPLERVLYSLGIFRLGRDVSRKLVERYSSMDEIRNLTADELMALEGIGPEITRNVIVGFRSQRVQRTLDLMERANVNMMGKPREKERETMAEGNNGNVAGKTFVVTGKLEGVTRNEIEGMIQGHGGRTSSSVTRATDYLVVGEKPGSKLTKAHQLGVTVIGQDELSELLAA